MQNIAFYRSGQCVSHTVKTMLFFTLTIPKCIQRQQQKQHGIPCCQFGVPNPQKCHSNGPKVCHNGPPRPSIRLHFMILCLPFCEVRKMIDFWRLWAGAGGRGRGLPKLQILQILETGPTRPAPPEGGAANI